MATEEGKELFKKYVVVNDYRYVAFDNVNVGGTSGKRFVAIRHEKCASC